MFNWLVSPTHSDSGKIDIPKPPRPNIELVQQLRQVDYNPRHYTLPENLTQEIKQEYQKRVLTREINDIFELDNTETNHNNEEQERINQAIKDIETQFVEWPQCDADWDSISSDDSHIDKKTKVVDAWGSPDLSKNLEMANLETTENSEEQSFEFDNSDRDKFIDNDERYECSDETNSENSENKTFDCLTPEQDDRNSNNELFISVEDTDKFEWHSFIPNDENDENDDSQDLFKSEQCQDFEKLLTTSQDLDNMETQVVVDVIQKLDRSPVFRDISPEHPEGYLELYIGPMFSGKSTKAFFKLSSMADQRFRCLYVNSSKDVRETESHDNFVSTHNSSYSRPSPKINCVKTNQLSSVDVSEYEYIAVDELQFFSDAYDTILDWVNQGKYVIVASLDGDCYRRKFGNVLDLVPHANQVTKLTAYCDICRDNYRKLTPAPFTARMTNDTTSELVGGKELYKAMCRNCHDFHLEITSPLI